MEGAPSIANAPPAIASARRRPESMVVEGNAAGSLHARVEAGTVSLAAVFERRLVMAIPVLKFPYLD
jgi:hypothetical protein